MDQMRDEAMDEVTEEAPEQTPLTTADARNALHTLCQYARGTSAQEFSQIAQAAHTIEQTIIYIEQSNGDAN